MPSGPACSGPQRQWSGRYSSSSCPSGRLPRYRCAFSHLSLIVRSHPTISVYKYDLQAEKIKGDVSTSGNIFSLQKICASNAEKGGRKHPESCFKVRFCSLCWPWLSCVIVIIEFGHWHEGEWLHTAQLHCFTTLEGRSKGLVVGSNANLMRCTRVGVEALWLIE